MLKIPQKKSYDAFQSLQEETNLSYFIVTGSSANIDSLP